jgi:hypothetical protein
MSQMAEFVPPDFEVPLGLQTSEFILEPLGPVHNEQDYEDWTSSMEHIAGTPGFRDGSWPREMTLDENRADLQRHADDFRNRDRVHVHGARSSEQRRDRVRLHLPSA